MNILNGFVESLKIFQRNGLSFNRFLKVLNGILILIFFSTPFIGFDSHHDGLTSATQKLIGRETSAGSSYVFNQYGPFWSLYLHIFDELFGDYALFTARVAMIIIFIATGLLGKRIVAEFSNENVAEISFVIYLLAYHIGYGWLPWPSGLATFCITLISFLVVREKSQSLSRSQSVVIGALVAVLCGNRAQIGTLTLVLTTAFFLIHNRRRLFSLAIGFLLGVSVLGVYVSVLGSLDEALNDIFIWPLVYINRDTTPFVVPIFTLLFASILAIFLMNIQRLFILWQQISARTRYLLSGAFTLLCFGILLNLSKLYISEIYASPFHVAERRLFVSGCLAIAVYSGVSLFIKARAGLGESANYNFRHKFVFGLATINMFQMFPLFDALHAWWSLTPILQIFLGVLHVRNRRLFTRKPVVMILVLSVLLTTLIYLRDLPRNLKELPGHKLIFVTAAQAFENEEVEKFFISNIREGATVINQCPDAEVFFLTRNFSSSSRFFLSWGSETLEEKLTNNHENLFLVSCSDENLLDPAEVAQVGLSLVTKAKLGGKNWNIFKITKLK